MATANNKPAGATPPAGRRQGARGRYVCACRSQASSRKRDGVRAREGCTPSRAVHRRPARGNTTTVGRTASGRTGALRLRGPFTGVRQTTTDRQDGVRAHGGVTPSCSVHRRPASRCNSCEEEVGSGSASQEPLPSHRPLARPDPCAARRRGSDAGFPPTRTLSMAMWRLRRRFGAPARGAKRPRRIKGGANYPSIILPFDPLVTRKLGGGG